MYALEYYGHLYNIEAKKKNDIIHFRVGGEKNGLRKYQNLDGSLTPEGRIHYGVGMSREEMAAAREAEESRQREIDYNRSKSIREMDDYELQNAVNRARLENQFEQTMMQRSTNFLQTQVTEETLRQEYDELMYQKSRVKAERFMQRAERLGKFVGNLAGSYGKIVDVKGKIEEVRAKRNIADQEEWKAKQQETKYNEGEWKFNKNMSEYARSLADNLSSVKKDLAEISGETKSGKQTKAEKKAAKAAEKEAKRNGGQMTDADYDNSIDYMTKELNKAKASGNKSYADSLEKAIADTKSTKKEAKESGKSSSKPEYIRKEGDRYIYDEKTQSKWDSNKEEKKGFIGRALDRRAAKKEAKAAEDKARADAKRSGLKAETRRQILGDRIDNNNSRGRDTENTLNSYFNGKDNRSKSFNYNTYSDKEKDMYNNSPTWKRKVDNEAAHKIESAKQRRISEALNSKKNSWDSSSLGNLGWGSSSDYNWSTNDVERQIKRNAGLNISDAAWKKRKHVKHSEEE